MVTPHQWSPFCSTSFNEDGGYQSYVTELATISSSFIEWMSRTNNNSTNALRILQNASSRSHYKYLQNSSRLLFGLSKSGLGLSVSTTRNEQLHYEFKTWMRNVRMLHITRFYIGMYSSFCVLQIGDTFISMLLSYTETNNTEPFDSFNS